MLTQLKITSINPNDILRYYISIFYNFNNHDFSYIIDLKSNFNATI